MSKAHADEALLARKVVVVTGASRGLGRAFAEDLAGRGALLVINGRDETRLGEVANGIRERGGEVLTVAGSVADDAVAERLVACALAEFGRLDALVNNAGIVRDRTLLKMTEAEFDDVIATNLRGTWTCGRHAARAMAESGGGSIVNVVSNAAFHGSVGQSNYGASKAGVAALTRAWSTELARFGIRVNAIWPIAVTDMTDVVLERFARAAEERGLARPTAAEIGFGDPAAIAPIVSFLVSELAADLTAQIITCNGTRVAVWSHPEERSLTERPAWRLEDYVDAFRNGTLAPEPMHPPKIGLEL
jgi:3-oxoacyl-[acyl-carrier protein] reductase